MTVRLYVGNLAEDVTDLDLETLFRNHGFQLAEARVIREPRSSRPRGFGFVEVESPAEADRAIATVHGEPYLGKTLIVERAKVDARRPVLGLPRRT